MRHKLNDKKLGRSGAHREALVRSLVCGLIEQGRIRTTLPKARQARQAAEKLVTICRRQTLSDRRLAASRLRKPAAVKVLFETIAPRYVQRPGGYTRILKLGQRRSDGAEMCLLEWVGPETELTDAPVDSSVSDADGTGDHQA